MPTIRRSKMKLAPEKVAALMASARRIDAQEAGEIKAQGRESVLPAIRPRFPHDRATAQGRPESVATSRWTNSPPARGIAKPNLSRLENSTATVPTLDTLERYALAVGYTVNLSLTPTHAKR